MTADRGNKGSSQSGLRKPVQVSIRPLGIATPVCLKDPTREVFTATRRSDECFAAF